MVCYHHYYDCLQDPVSLYARPGAIIGAVLRVVQNGKGLLQLALILNQPPGGDTYMQSERR